MCEACGHITVNKQSRKLDLNKYDPTKTAALRNAMVRDMNRRFTDLIRLIREVVIDDDVFGLNKENLVVFAEKKPGKKEYQFLTKEEKVNEFMKWLDSQINSGLLEVREIQQIGKATNQAWTNKYIEDSYKRGVIRARYELNKAGFPNIPNIDATGGPSVSMNTPFHLERVGLLYSRTFQDLKGITTTMETQISRILSQGIADGDGPKLLARKLVSAIDGTNAGTLGTTDSIGRFIPAKRRAEILARTEIIRAHHQATIQEYRNWAAEDVVVQAEFQTAGDDRVCSVCASLQGKIFSLDAIQNMIPVHPQCRCIALPTLPDENLEEIPTEVPKVEEIAVPKSTFNYLENNGWYTNDIDSKKGIIEFEKNFKNQIKGFNIAELDSDLNNIISKHQIEAETFSKELLVYKDQVQIILKGFHNGDAFELKRVFSDKMVEHNLFLVPEEIQGKGFAKDILKTFYKQYQKSGIKNIEIYANIDVGGYAWGRYGFQAQIDDVATILQKYTRNYGEFANEANLIFDTWLEQNPNATHFPMNLLADADFGKDLLLGKSSSSSSVNLGSARMKASFIWVTRVIWSGVKPKKNSIKASGVMMVSAAG